MSTTHNTSGPSANEPLATKINYKFLSEEQQQTLHFRLSHVDVSVANALRRTLLSDIPINVIRTELIDSSSSSSTKTTSEQCQISVNTGRLTNEILKHRLSLIPIHSKHVSSWELAEELGGSTGRVGWLDRLPTHVELEVNVQADDTLRFVTTEDFRLRVKTAAEDGTKRYLPTTVSQQIFPKNDMTQSFIEFARLRPKLAETIPGEQLHLVAQFSVATAKENSAFNVVAKCAFHNTQQEDLSEVWEKELAKQQTKDKLSADEAAARKKDFMCLDAQRHFIDESFDFVVQTVGIYRNEELLQTACKILQDKVLALYDSVRDNEVLVRRSDAVSMDHCYDVTLVKEDYTLGNVLVYLLIDTYYDDAVDSEHRLSFCGFKKEHPHDENSLLRLAFEEAGDEAKVRECLRTVCGKAHAIFERIESFFR
jgi:DNA-directed RNA polymerase subunit L